MAIISTPVAARVRFTYLEPGMPALRINGISPTVSAFALNRLGLALGAIQTAPVHDGFLTRESDLTEQE